MTYVLVLNGVVEHCISVNSIDDLTPYYPQHLIIERTGDENIGWTFDGTTFSPPG